MDKEKQEVIFQLREQNYSYGFISKLLGIPMSTVKATCSRAKVKPTVPRKTKEEESDLTNFCKCCYKPLDKK